MYFSLGSLVNGRVIELLLGALFVYVGYVKFSAVGMNFIFSYPVLVAHALIFFAVGGLMVLSRPHIAVVGLAVVALGISLHGLGFFNSFSLSYLVYRFSNQVAMFLTDFLMPIAAAFWAFKGGFG